MCVYVCLSLCLSLTHTLTKTNTPLTLHHYHYHNHYKQVPEMGEDHRMQIQYCNWQVVNPTTPANYFHALRRQVRVYVWITGVYVCWYVYLLPVLTPYSFTAAAATTTTTTTTAAAAATGAPRFQEATHRDCAKEPTQRKEVYF